MSYMSYRLRAQKSVFTLVIPSPIMVAMNPAPPSNPEELRRMLNYGMGRAILYLLKQDLSQYRDLILDMCLHHQWYDQQCTGSETFVCYIYPLIQASGDMDYYQDEILRALRNETDYERAYQLLEFAKFFAQRGDDGARQAIYDKVRLNNIKEPMAGEHLIAGADVLVELDGLNALTYLLDTFGSELHLLGHYGLEDLVREAEKTAGVEEVRFALKSAVEKNPKVVEALALVEDYSIDWSAEEIVRRREERAGRWKAENTIASQMSWEDVKRRGRSLAFAGRWSRTASDEDLRNAALDLDPSAEFHALRNHLAAFRKRPFPLDPEPLLGLVDHPDHGVSARAFAVLGMVHSENVRELFFRLIRRPEMPWRTLFLLRSNYETEDCRIISDILATEMDEDTCHSCCSDTIEVYKANPVAEGLEPLLTVYEKTPCPLCRDRCVELLESMGMLPDWMAQEHKYAAAHD